MLICAITLLHPEMYDQHFVSPVLALVGGVEDGDQLVLGVGGGGGGQEWSAGGGVGVVGRVGKQYWLIHTDTSDVHNLKFIVLYSADLNKEG